MQVRGDRKRSGVRICFHWHDARRVVTFRPICYKRNNIDEESFASLPAGVMVASEPCLGSGETCTPEEYHEWQKNLHKNSQSAITIYAVNYARISPESAATSPAPEDCFFLKVAPHVDDRMAGGDMKKKLRDEALFYKDHLSSVQGEAVPIHYGVWEGRTEWGSMTAISIMQWGGVPYFTHIKGTEQDVSNVK